MDSNGEHAAYNLFQRGLDQLHEGKTRRAAHSLEQAAHLEPEASSIREALGRSYYRMRRYEEAAEVFAEIISHEPLDDYVHFCLGRCYDRLGDNQRALHHYRLASTLGQKKRAMYERALRRFRQKQRALGDEEE